MAQRYTATRSLRVTGIGALLAGLAGVALAQDGAVPGYAFDPTHTFVYWEVVHMGTSTLRGRFDRSTGSAHFDPKVRRLDVSVVVDTDSVSTGNALLDAQLRGARLLDVASHPKAYFTATGADFEGEAPREIRGEFTLHGVSRPLTLHATRWKCAYSVLFRRDVCGGDFEARFDRSAFGISYVLPLVSDQVRLLIAVEAIAQ
jgi:polyisoprenoid-binding protein YceI